MVAQHQQEWFISHRFPGAVDRVTEAFLGSLDDKGNVPAHLQQAAGIFLGLGRKFIVVLDGNLFGEQETEIVQVVFLHNDYDFLDPGFQRFLDNDQDGRFGNAVPVHDGE